MPVQPHVQPGAPFAKPARYGMLHRIAAPREGPIAGPLIGVGAGLIAIRERLIAGRESLVILRRSRLGPFLARMIGGTFGTIVRL